MPERIEKVALLTQICMIKKTREQIRAELDKIKDSFEEMAHKKATLKDLSQVFAYSVKKTGSVKFTLKIWICSYCYHSRIWLALKKIHIRGLNKEEGERFLRDLSNFLEGWRVTQAVEKVEKERENGY